MLVPQIRSEQDSRKYSESTKLPLTFSLVNEDTGRANQPRRGSKPAVVQQTVPTVPQASNGGEGHRLSAASTAAVAGGTPLPTDGPEPPAREGEPPPPPLTAVPPPPPPPAGHRGSCQGAGKGKRILLLFPSSSTPSSSSSFPPPPALGLSSPALLPLHPRLGMGELLVPCPEGCTGREAASPGLELRSSFCRCRSRK